MSERSGRPSALGGLTEWLHRLGDAWEAGDANALGQLFVVGATMRPTPFEDLRRGRRQIVGYFTELFESTSNASFRAQVLGAGETYGVAQFTVSYTPRRGGSQGQRERSRRQRDGILLAAFDERGRCTSLRQWWHESEQSAG